MLDASGKFGLEGGLFDGNLVAFGDFDECLAIDVEESKSTYDGVSFTIPAFKGLYTTNKFQLRPLDSKYVIS